MGEVSIGLPLYKRLDFLPAVLRSIMGQDYPNIELIVSDNGMNGSRIRALIDRDYPKNYKFRQNRSIVTMSTHFNQIIHAASGKYFMILCDDDEISSNYVSELVTALERYPEATIAVSRQEIMDKSGQPLAASSERLPPLLRGPEFIKATWDSRRYRFFGFASILARTEDLRAAGGYPEFWKGLSHDDALVVKLCLDRAVALCDRCTFRKRVYESSHGSSISIQDMAQATKQLFGFLDSDPKFQHFASANPAEWKQLKNIIGKMNWQFYFQRWKELDPNRLTTLQWLKAGFALPFIPAYYREVVRTLAETSTRSMRLQAKKFF
jgi:glycosyltransferase involved in cell wall biosynthesis